MLVLKNFVINNTSTADVKTCEDKWQLCYWTKFLWKQNIWTWWPPNCILVWWI